jgi:tape measure domain-containing protein
MARPIVADLVTRDRSWSRGLRKAEHDTVRFSASVRRMGAVSVAAFGGAGVAAAGLAAAGGLLGLKTAASLETAEVGFTRLLGSAKRARSFLGDLKTFAARTPFELPGLVDASRALVGAGTAAKDVIPILSALGDASGALGLDQERFGRVMIAVTQIMNRGKVQSEELMQITEAGIPVWQLLADATGKPIPELQKLASQGKLLAKDTLPALFAQMRKDYGGGMVAQSKTLAGVWSTFKDTVALTLSDVLTPLLPMLKTSLPVAAEAFKNAVGGGVTVLGDMITKGKEWWETDGPAVKVAFEKAKDEVVKLGGELADLKKDWDDNKAAVQGLIDTLKPLAAVTLPTITWLVHRLATDEIGGKFGLIAQVGFLSRTFTWVFKRIVGEFQPVVNAILFGNERILSSAATVAEALHLPMARSLRKAADRMKEFRADFNREMDKLQGKGVAVTAKAGLTFSPSFTRRDWLAARQAAGRMHTGGRIPGYGGGDTVPILAERGEAVVDKVRTRRYAPLLAAMGVPGFAAGGTVDFTGSLGRFPRQLDQLSGAHSGIARLMGGWIGGILVKALKKLGGGSAAIKAFIRSTDALNYFWGGAGPNVYDCSGLVGAVALAHRGKPYGHGQRVWTTATIRAGMLGIKPGLGGVLQIGVTPTKGHMAGRYGGLGFEAESTRTGIKIGSAASRPESFARHFHMARGGLLTGQLAALAGLRGIDIGGDQGKIRINGRVFDSGGYLPPRSATLAINRTSRYEPVGGRPTELHIHVHAGTVIGGNLDKVTRELAPKMESAFMELSRRRGARLGFERYHRRG